MGEPGPCIGVLATMSELYRRLPELQARMEAWAAELTAALGADARVICPRVCDTRAQVERAVAEITAGGAELLVVLPLTYAPSHLVLPSLKGCRLPLLILNCQIIDGFIAQADARAFLDNQAPTGLLDLANALVRGGIPFRVASGHYRDPLLLAELRQWCAAAHAAAAARRMRVGLAGHAMDGMGDLAVDSTLLLERLGAEIIHVPVAEIAGRAEAASAAEVRGLVEEDHARFTVDPALSREEHAVSARLVHALRSIVDAMGLDALSFHFEALLADGRIPTVPVLEASRLLASGTGYAGEGDVTCASLVALMARLCGQAEFFETWGIDFSAQCVMKNHMGEGNFALAREDLPVRLMRAPVGLGDTVAPAAPCFVLRPGDATLVNLTTTRGGGMRLTVVEGRVPLMDPLPGVRTPHGAFLPPLPVKRFLESWALAGASHHCALVYGRQAAAVERLAWILGLELETVQPAAVASA